MMIDVRTVTARIAFFQTNSHPATLRSPGFPARRKSPLSVPEGQIHEQK
jgi:hypothetical protein